jgi:pimeloyl-ACP methyl ester carboxylesterase
MAKQLIEWGMSRSSSVRRQDRRATAFSPSIFLPFAKSSAFEFSVFPAYPGKSGVCFQIHLVVLPLVMSFVLLLSGCSTPDIHPASQNLVVFLPGGGGDDSVYSHAMESLAAHGNDDHLHIQNWGYRWPFLLFTISSLRLHEQIERQVAEEIVRQRWSFPKSRIVLIGHSAGAGAVLGAVARLPAAMRVGPIILLAPDLSPEFNLKPALSHSTSIDVFYNPHDCFWQGFGPILVGTYDRVHCVGAGKRGFRLDSFSLAEKLRVKQYQYQEAWKSLGENGGHFDWMAPDFFAAVIAPLIDAAPSPASAGTTQSSGVNPR